MFEEEFEGDRNYLQELAEARQEIRRLTDQLLIVGQHAAALESQVEELQALLDALGGD